MTTILILNDPSESTNTSQRVPHKVAADLLDRAREAKAEAIDDDGLRCGPETERSASKLGTMAGALASLHPREHLSDPKVATAFWLNLYNALVIHAALHFRVRRSVREVKGFFSRAAYRVGDHLLSLNDIEHGVLRANRGHPLRILVPQFMPWDAKRSLAIRPFDRRIHFALNCGAASCPPVRHYTAGDVNAELELASRSFVASGGVRIDDERGDIVISRLLGWYARDFGWTRRRQLSSVEEFLDDRMRDDVRRAASVAIRYDEYDWTIA